MTDQPEMVDHVRTASRPSDLRITDMRIANLVGLPVDVSLIRIDTNQGISVPGWRAAPSPSPQLKASTIGRCRIPTLRKIVRFIVEKTLEPLLAGITARYAQCRPLFATVDIFIVTLV